MKKNDTFLAAVVFFLGVTTVNAQESRVGVNTTTPKTTLDVNGKTDTSGNLLTTDITGLQAPRLTRAELTAKGNTLYGTDQRGALVYITDISGGDAASQRVNITSAGYYYFDGSVWQKVGASTGGSTANEWHITGNGGTTAGTNFVGTTDATDFVTKTNNNEVMRVTSSGNVGIGTSTPNAQLETTKDVIINGHNVGRGNGNSINNIAFGKDVLQLATPSGIAQGQRNVGVGNGALKSLTTAEYNTSVGHRSLESLVSGTSNDAFGGVTLASLSSGNNNAAFGSNSLGNLATGDKNTAVGGDAFNPMINGNYNTAIGYAAGDVFSSGDYNIAIGAYATLPNSNGSNQLGIGKLVYGTDINNITDGRIGIGTKTPATRLDVYGLNNGTTAGAIKIVDGTQGLGKVLTSDANGLATWQTASGGSGWALTGNSGTTAGTNFIGTTDAQSFVTKVNSTEAMRVIWDATNTATQVAIGVTTPATIFSTTSGYNATNQKAKFTVNGNASIGGITVGGQNNGGNVLGAVLGYQALYNFVADPVGTGNVAIGSKALYSATSPAGDMAIGNDALYSLTTGRDNIALGWQSQRNLTTGNNNVSIGNLSLTNNITGTNNIALGSYALNSNTGNSNVAIGSFALRANSTGFNNTAIGHLSLTNNTLGMQNTALGSGALYSNTTGEENTAIGQGALNLNSSGSSNVALGNVALTNSTGYRNTAIGYGAFKQKSSGNNNVAVGYNSGLNDNTGDNNIIVGALQNSPVASGSNQLNIGGAIFGTGLTGNASTPAGNIGIGTTSPSTRLEVNNGTTAGAIKIVDGTQGLGKVLTSDANGLATWKTPSSGGTTYTATAPISINASNDISITRNAIDSGGASSSTATSPITVSGGKTDAVVGGSDVTLTVNNTAPLWNANQLQGKDIAAVAPTDGQLLKYNGTTNKWEPYTLTSSAVYQNIGGGVATYSAGDTIADNIFFVKYDGLAAGSLTTPTPVEGKVIYVRNLGLNAVTVSGQSINGGRMRAFVCDGTTWYPTNQ